MGGGAPRMLRTRTKDNAYDVIKLLFRYWLYGAVPASLIVAYTNLFVGNAVLHDYDPELYEPEEDEFYKYPIQRWLAKYIVEDPKVTYYKQIQQLEIAMQFGRQVRFTTEVFQLQKLEDEGMIPFFDHPVVSRDLRDELDAWANQNNFAERPSER
nr:NADH dehydrogenase [ubiquinone] 1 beta subcomplex subunit 5, mitochondrial [Phallusia mammillata]